ncbi:1-aminocyclopropane-1-carboxylate deaminase/D-cysteine desulfhydrase [Pseudonocardia sp. WMMC193]|uniref:1-aminocyclopropane-1-carboxylate deaminase/D-cysteine desulfhydrase n=1 Tax=Pseudonocardia sp. WMMC193 TaxID=2911965 RepID=UPI001F1B573A|nr:pyridoxal-phosphate dependent enzyme [Pseudonocardia sp. WMMC193]MCF7552160.1 pyridoxal-phosphate dependent enzyme [Pseudonocardia sp. WMMC193]
MTVESHLDELKLVVPSPVQEIDDERLARHGIRLILKRDDLIHPEIPGNKWRKLKYNLEEAKAAGHTRILTFGGAYSNHIRAVAAAGYYFGFETVGLIRGEEHLPLNPTLAYATAREMTLEYIDREHYRQKTSNDVLGPLRERYGDFFLVPEGGSNAAAVRGVAELPAEIDFPYDVLCAPIGTGGTLAGLATGVPRGVRVLGFSALKGGAFLAEDVQNLQLAAGQVTDNWDLQLDFHFGGFARRPAALREFAQDFEVRHGVSLELTYVAKMLAGIVDMASTRQFPSGSVVVAVVTGPSDA